MTKKRGVKKEPSVYKNVEEYESQKQISPKQKRALVVFWSTIAWIILIVLLVMLLQGCSTRVHCNSKTTKFLGMEFHSPIPQKCADRPNRATDIVGW